MKDCKDYTIDTLRTLVKSYAKDNEALQQQLEEEKRKNFNEMVGQADSMIKNHVRETTNKLLVEDLLERNKQLKDQLEKTTNEQEYDWKQKCKERGNTIKTLNKELQEHKNTKYSSISEQDFNFFIRDYMQQCRAKDNDGDCGKCKYLNCQGLHGCFKTYIEQNKRTK